MRLEPSRPRCAAPAGCRHAAKVRRRHGDDGLWWWVRHPSQSASASESASQSQSAGGAGGVDDARVVVQRGVVGRWMLGRWLRGRRGAAKTKKKKKKKKKAQRHGGGVATRMRRRRRRVRQRWRDDRVAPGAVRSSTSRSGCGRRCAGAGGPWVRAGTRGRGTSNCCVGTGTGATCRASATHTHTHATKKRKKKSDTHIVSQQMDGDEGHCQCTGRGRKGNKKACCDDKPVVPRVPP